MEPKVYVDCLSVAAMSTTLLLRSMKHIILNDKLYSKDPVNALLFEVSISSAETCATELMKIAYILNERGEEQLDVGDEAERAFDEATFASNAFEFAEKTLRVILVENKEDAHLVSDVQVVVHRLLSHIMEISDSLRP